MARHRSCIVVVGALLSSRPFPAQSGSRIGGRKHGPPRGGLPCSPKLRSAVCRLPQMMDRPKRKTADRWQSNAAAASRPTLKSRLRLDAGPGDRRCSAVRSRAARGARVAVVRTFAGHLSLDCVSSEGAPSGTRAARAAGSASTTAPSSPAQRAAVKRQPPVAPIVSASRPSTPASIGQRPPHCAVAVVWRALNLGRRHRRRAQRSGRAHDAGSLLQIGDHGPATRRPHRTGRCALRLKIPAHSYLLAAPHPRVAAFVPNPCAPVMPSRSTETLHLLGFYIGAPGFEPGTSPTRSWTKSEVGVGSTCKPMGSHAASALARPTDIAVDYRGFGREMDSLPKPCGCH